MTLDRDQLRAFAQRYTAAWCSQDPQRVAACYSPQGSLTINRGQAAVGRDKIAHAAQSFMSAFPDMRVAMDDLRLVGGSPQYHWTLTGTNTGPGGSGRNLCISGFEVWTIGGDGLIASSHGHFDEADYERQLRG